MRVYFATFHTYFYTQMFKSFYKITPIYSTLKYFRLFKIEPF
jgi:hypothetical protein